MKKFLLLASVACVVTACQTMDSVKTSFSESYTSVSNLFVNRNAPAPCPSFAISDELDSYYDLPGAETKNSSALSSATIDDISGNCRLNENENIITVSMDIDFTAMAGGEAGKSLTKKTLEIPYFIAVLDKDQEIMAKDTFIIPLELSGAQMNTYHRERLQQNIPYLKEKDPSQYTIIAGFQLDPSQLSFAKLQDKVAKIKPAAGNAAVSINTSSAPDPFAGR